MERKEEEEEEEARGDLEKRTTGHARNGYHKEDIDSQRCFKMFNGSVYDGGAAGVYSPGNGRGDDSQETNQSESLRDVARQGRNKKDAKKKKKKKEMEEMKKEKEMKKNGDWEKNMKAA